MDFISLFSGIEGFGSALESVGMRCVLQVERDRDCRRVLARHWPDVVKLGDVCNVRIERVPQVLPGAAGDGIPQVRKEGSSFLVQELLQRRRWHPCNIKLAAIEDARAREIRNPNSSPEQRRVQDRSYELPAADVICAGFPCQDLSVAGRRAGFGGERSVLFFEITRLIRELRDATDGKCPTFVLLENVPGLLSSNGGRDFALVLRELAESGAMDIAWTILDSQWFGLPQRRRRVFIVADFGGTRAGQILFEPEGVCGDSPPSREAKQRVAAGLTAGTASGRGVNSPGRRREDDVNLAFCLNAKGGCGRIDGESETFIPVAHTLRADGFDASEDGRLTGSVPTTSGVPRPVQDMDRVIAFDTTQVTSKGNYSVPKAGAPCHPLAAGAHPAAIAFTQRTRNGHANVECSDDVAFCSQGVRRLTPRECERLQGFEDDWTRWDADGKELSDSARYRMLGNAVSKNVAKWIGRRILASQ